MKKLLSISLTLCTVLSVVFATGSMSATALNQSASNHKIYLRFPGGMPKCATFSFDDGLKRDERTVDILLENGQKGTFFLVSGYLDKYNNINTKEDAKELYSQSGLEVANHSVTHRGLSTLSSSEQNTEVASAQAELKALFNTAPIGFAYPNGDSNLTDYSCLKNNGIKYARTAGFDKNLNLPKDWLHWEPTGQCIATHINKAFEDFIKIKQTTEPKLFYMWGHSYDFDNNNCWGTLEYICSTLAEQDNVWAATNGEVYNYCTAFDKLQVTDTNIHNASSTDLWFSYSLKIYKIKAGATFTNFFANPAKWANADSGSSKVADNPKSTATASKTKKASTKKSTAKKEDTKDASTVVSDTDETQDDAVIEEEVKETKAKDSSDYTLILVIVIGGAVLIAGVVVTIVLLSSKKKKPSNEED